MAIIERDVILQGKTEEGQPTLDFPITRLSNIEASCDIKSKAEAGDYIPIIDGQDDNMKMVPVEELLPKNEDNYVRSNKNFIRNAIFKHPVNRRGKTEYVCNVFTRVTPSTIDLWGTSATPECPLRVKILENEHCITLSTKSYMQFFQKVVDCNDLLGKTVTISALIDRNIAGNMYIGFDDILSSWNADEVKYYTKSIPIQSGIQLISYTVTLPVSLTYKHLLAYIQPVDGIIETDVSMKLYGMKVELGDTQTLARMNSDGVWELIDDPDYAEEYAYCEKYDLDDYSFVGDYHVNENLIPNWDFRNPMNSQGGTEYGNYIQPTSATGWTTLSIDDWYVPNIGVQLTIKDGYVNLKGYGNDYSVFPAITRYMKFKYAPFTNGDVLTMSYLCKVHDASYDTQDLTFQIDNDTKKDYTTFVTKKFYKTDYEKLILVSGTVTIPHTWEKEDKLRCTIFTQSYRNLDVDLYAVKIEFGSVSTLAHLDSNGRYVIHNTGSRMNGQLLFNQFSYSDGEYFPIGRSNPNLLDNWYLIDPINQRNMTEYTKSGHMIDRWNLTSGTLRLSSDGVILSPTESVKGQFGQYVYNIKHLLGKTVILSALINGKIYTEVTRLSEKMSYPFSKISVEMDGIRLYMHQTSETSGFGVGIQNKIGNDPITISAIKLEEGCCQTLARKIGDEWVLNDPPPNKVLELMKCQRYLYNPLYKSTGKYSRLGYGYRVSEKEVNIVIPIPTVMEKRPIPINISNMSVTKIGAEIKEVHNVVSITTDSNSMLAGSIALKCILDETTEYGMYVLSPTDGLVGSLLLSAE